MIQIPVIHQEEENTWGSHTKNNLSNLCASDHKNIGLFLVRKTQSGAGTQLQESTEFKGRD